MEPLEAVVDVAAVASAAAGGGPSGPPLGGADAPFADWAWSAANRLCRNEETASLASLVDVLVDASVDVAVAVDEADDEEPLLESSEMPSDANAFWMADANRLMPPVGFVDDKSLLVDDWFVTDEKLNSCAIDGLAVLLIDEMDMMGFLDG